jgi:type 1 glutamine amidotransferase
MNAKPSHRISAILATILGLAGFAGARADDKPIRALLIAGGCCHDYEHQKDILTRGISRRADVKWTIAYDPDRTTRHKNPIYARPDWAKDFDVIVHDECSSDVNDKNAIDTILKPHKDGLPAVVLHCAMHSYRTEGWNKNVATPWMQLTGVISTGHGPQTPIAISFVDKESPITLPLGDWTTVNEELYNNAAGKLEPTAHALARGKQSYTIYPRVAGKEDRTVPGSKVAAESVVVWTNTYNGKTKVFATTLGHNNETVADARYLDLVTRGLLWSVDKLDDTHFKKVDAPEGRTQTPE